MSVELGGVPPRDLDFLFLAEPREGRTVLDDGLDDSASRTQTILEPVQQTLRVDGCGDQCGKRDCDRRELDFHVAPPEARRLLEVESPLAVIRYTLVRSVTSARLRRLYWGFEEQPLRPVITTESFWLWFGGIWLTVGLAFLAIGGGIGLSRGSVDTGLAANGVRVEGTVLSKELSAPDNGSERYHVTFRFDDGQERTIRGTAELDAESWDALVERGPIEIVYLANDPQKYRVTGQRGAAAVVVFIFTVIGGVIAVIGGALVVHTLGSRRIRRELLRSGASAAATVIEVGPSGLHINGVPLWQLRYRFRDARGRAHEGKCKLAADEAQRWQAGSAGRVIYDTRDARVNVWTGEGA